MFFLKKGFTMLEIVIALFVFTVGLGSSYALIQKNVLTASLAEDRLIAAYLAQEGIEIVRNIRDSNWLKDDDWNDGLPENISGPGYEADYTSASLEHYYEANFLNINQDGFYGYSAGTPTKFTREIFIDIPDEDLNKMIVEVIVRWSERGRDHDFKIIEHLYNWKP